VLNPAEVNLALHNSNALIIPSRYEGDPLVVREAMATGIPIIGSDIPAITFACKTYKNFIKIEKPLNAPQIVNAVEKLISNNNFLPSPEIRSYDEVAKEYLKFYNKLVDIFLPDFPKKTLKNTLNS
jgi:glycosyltransferase involved in cell wall biosynthesis